MTKPLWLISYDIADARRLRRIQQYCASRGWPLQKSLYLLPLNKAEKSYTCDTLLSMLDLSQDKLLCLPFITAPGSFHCMPNSDVLLVHDDPRLTGFIS